VSLTIQGLLVVMLGFVIDNAEIANSLATDLVIVGGIVMSWYGRYRQGNVDLLGFRK
jgi:hypothetical protein